MTTVQEIAEQMRQQGMSDRKIKKWLGAMRAYKEEQRTPRPNRAQDEPQGRHKAPSRKAIAEYWLDTTMPTSYSEFSDFQRKLAQQDCGEPSCWACGYYKPNADAGHTKHPSPYSCWDNAKWLEKCHIVPHMLGGSNDASNFVLLCSRCHKEAPDNKRAKHMFRFVTNREGYHVKSFKILEQIPRCDLELVGQQDESFMLWCLDNNVGYHSGGDHRQTMANAIEDFAEDYRDGLITPEYIDEIKQKYQSKPDKKCP